MVIRRSFVSLGKEEREHRSARLYSLLLRGAIRLSRARREETRDSLISRGSEAIGKEGTNG